MGYWKTTDFWGKLRDTFALLGSLATGGMAGLNEMAMAHIGTKWFLVSGLIGLAGTVLGIWMTDKDKDGKVDVFQ